MSSRPAPRGRLARARARAPATLALYFAVLMRHKFWSITNNNQKRINHAAASTNGHSAVNFSFAIGRMRSNFLDGGGVSSEGEAGESGGGTCTVSPTDMNEDNTPGHKSYI